VVSKVAFASEDESHAMVMIGEAHHYGIQKRCDTVSGMVMIGSHRFCMRHGVIC
jgi:hypothetical protein